MKSNKRMRKILLGGMFFLSGAMAVAGMRAAAVPVDEPADTVSFNRERLYPDSIASAVPGASFSRRFIHRFELEGRPGYVLQTNSFLKGENGSREAIRRALSGHLKYSFQFRPGTPAGRVYPEAYQGIGFSYYTFGEREELGDPVAFYLFQGARIARFSPRLSLNYEWNFGVSAGWQPYDQVDNRYNKSIGSKLNAYLNLNFYLNWTLSRQFDLTAGASLSHFSNGNTQIPNAGLNTTAAKIGLVYYVNRTAGPSAQSFALPPAPEFPRHISYDLVFFGSWRRKGVFYEDKQIASPDAYPVAGFSFAPMYNLGYKFRIGAAIDGVYDGSANLYLKDFVSGGEQEFFRPPARYQLALGLSARAEYVMPYFTVGIGMGGNMLYAGPDLKGFYQLLALKINMTRHSFLHVGYNLQNFHTPNYLMLGIGFRFHNRYPVVRR